MKKIRKTIALILAVAIISSAFLIPVGAATRIDPEDGFGAKAEISFYQFVDKLIVVLGKILNALIPGLNWTNRWPNIKSGTPAGLMPGEDSFDTNVQESSKWSMGYASDSLIQGLDIMDGSYYMAGSLSVGGRTPSQILDDQRVCVYAVSDGVSGTVVHAVLDGYGIARGDVIEIRNRLAAFAAENNIISINVSVMHQHSGIDTLGLGAPLVSALFSNPFNSILNKDLDDFVSGVNPSFREAVYSKTTECIKTAVNAMTEGKLYYGNTDISDYIYDKREPIVFDGNLNRLRFIPDNDELNEIWVCELAVHCVNLGAGTDIVSGDYPYYFRNYIKEMTGADVVMVEGAELAITTEYDNLQPYEDTDRASGMKQYAKEIGDKTISISNDTELSPVLNVKFSEVTITPTNEILVLCVREGLINSVVAKNSIGGIYLVSEIGYIELGNNVGILCIPGEMMAEIVYGGVQPAEKTWTGDEWDYSPLAETAGAENIMVYGLCNDQMGYIIADSDVRSMLTENEEVVASSTSSASTIVKGFEQLIASVK